MVGLSQNLVERSAVARAGRHGLGFQPRNPAPGEGRRDFPSVYGRKVPCSPLITSTCARAESRETSAAQGFSVFVARCAFFGTLIFALMAGYFGVGLKSAVWRKRWVDCHFRQTVARVSLASMAANTAPRHVVMLAFAGAQILDVVGPLQILSGVNDERATDSPAYRLTLLGERKGAFLTTSGVRLVADGAWSDLPRAIDTLIVAGGDGVREAMRSKPLRDALKRGAARARRVVSVCSGAFLLAGAGLLKDKRATTHWRAAAQLAEAFPDIAVEPDAIYVRDGRVWTSAGVTAGMDLALALVREDFGDEMALTLARRHVLYLVRPGGQSQFSAHLAVQGEGKLARLLRWIPDHVGEALDVPALAERSHMSARNFARVFRAETGKTPAHYVECARLDAARMLLAQSKLSVDTVAARSGFGSEERMRRAFQRHLKVSPALFRERFSTLGGAS
jgi:transcriptional regulator GlxA family with amidase domain